MKKKSKKPVCSTCDDTGKAMCATGDPEHPLKVGTCVCKKPMPPGWTYEISKQFPGAYKDAVREDKLLEANRKRMHSQLCAEAGVQTLGSNSLCMFFEDTVGCEPISYGPLMDAVKLSDGRWRLRYMSAKRKWMLSTESYPTSPACLRAFDELMESVSTNADKTK